MEDVGGVSLLQLLSYGPLGVDQFLSVAQSITDAVVAIHQQKLIHKGICPENIIIDPETNLIKIIDFGIASELFLENQEAINPDCLEGTLDYLSPEQTGRMNRFVDYRTDLYALGITFYHMLTGAPPFAMSDAMGMVHAHIAKIPEPVNQKQESVPEVVADIVAKLMSKTAEERYQSAVGLKYDLVQCSSQWKACGKITPFELAQKDASGVFSIPQKLYGRGSEVDLLMSAFDRVAKGATEMLLVAGYSGVGKSALIQEVHKPIVAKRGYFIAGKFDQILRNIPYSALTQAFRDLMK